jgi:hypothetical protein
MWMGIYQADAAQIPVHRKFGSVSIREVVKLFRAELLTQFSMVGDNGIC